MISKRWKQTIGFIAIGVMIAVFSFVYFRNVYSHSKRLREVVPGKVYRSGQMTEAGFRDAIKRYNIRTIVNLQQDNLDPDLPHNWFDRRTVKESKMCEDMGVRYVVIEPDLVPPSQEDKRRPQAVDEFLRLMDDESIYPVLFHCKAGLHRTGILAAVYRMEYQGWTHREAFDELKAHGFGRKTCHSGNVYVTQYVLKYKKGERRLPESASAKKNANTSR